MRIPRRHCLKTMALAGGGILCTGASHGGSTQMSDRDQYGGWTGKTFEATGFFSTAHDGQRWWLVTADGNAFLIFGVNP